LELHERQSDEGLRAADEHAPAVQRLLVIQRDSRRHFSQPLSTTLWERTFARRSRASRSGFDALRLGHRQAEGHGHAHKHGQGQRSSDPPAPPWAWMAQSITWQATLGACTLIMAISLRAALLPAMSIFHAALSTMQRAPSIMIRASAMRCLVPPYPAIARQNVTRSEARRHIFSSATSACPIRRMQW